MSRNNTPGQVFSFCSDQIFSKRFTTGGTPDLFSICRDLFGLILPAILLSALPCVAQGNPSEAAVESEVQFVQPSTSGQTAAPITITLHDALERARKFDAQLFGAVLDAKVAHEDRLQARNAMLPQVTGTSQYLGTQGDGGKISDGRFVTNDGIHVYREWGVLHQDLSPATLMRIGYNRAKAAEAIAKAKAEIARRGLAVTVTKNYYALVTAQRKYAIVQDALQQSKHFFDITQDSERQGQSPHSDAVKAEVQYRMQQQTFDEARLTMEDARLNLAVMLFPTLNQDFSVVDDLDSAQSLPAFPEIEAMAVKENPDIQVAMETLRASDLDVKAAQTAFLPTLTVETDYGIEANAFALHSTRASFPELGPVPNLGYFVTAVLSVPVWDWGTLRSKLHQAEYKQQEAHALLNQEQRQQVAELYAAYNEASVARASINAARHTAELATESLRLSNLRYTGGAAPATEIIDAESMVVQTQGLFVDAQVRYRTALATLQTFTGNF